MLRVASNAAKISPRNKGENTLTLHRLVIYQCVAKHLNLSKAARELRISQPSVFQQLKLLESDMELRLYRKSGRGIELTGEGRLFLKDADAILERVGKLKENAKAGFYKWGLGTLRVAAGYGPSATYLPPALKAFRNSYPHVQPVLYTNMGSASEEMILEARADLALTTYASNLPLLVCEPFAQEEIVLFASAGHPLAKKKRLAVSNLHQMPAVVLRRPGSKGLNTEKFLRQMHGLGAEMRVVMSCDAPEAVKACVIGGMGVGILFRSTISPDVKAGSLKILDLPAVTVKLDTYIMYHRKRPLSPYAQSFLELLRRYRRAN